MNAAVAAPPRAVVAVVVVVLLVTITTTSSLLPTNLSYRPCPAPNFDVFREHLIGSSWTAQEEPPKMVQEVMRSCGGAVQGIREPLHTHNDDNDDDSFHYLNRANDGFIIFDNGCYTLGPTTTQGDTNKKDLYLCNVMVKNHGDIESQRQRRRRLVVTGTAESVDHGASLQQQTTTNTEPLEPPSIQLESDPLTTIRAQCFTVTRCSMSATQQQHQQPPWMLQRAKWDRATTTTTSTVIDDEPTNDASDRELSSASKSSSTTSDTNVVQYWSTTTTPANAFYEWMGLSSSNNNDNNGKTNIKDDDDDQSTKNDSVVHVGAMFNGTVTVVARHYKSNDELQCVLLVEGKQVD